MFQIIANVLILLCMFLQVQSSQSYAASSEMSITTASSCKLLQKSLNVFASSCMLMQVKATQTVGKSCKFLETFFQVHRSQSYDDCSEKSTILAKDLILVRLCKFLHVHASSCLFMQVKATLLLVKCPQ